MFGVVIYSRDRIIWDNWCQELSGILKVEGIGGVGKGVGEVQRCRVVTGLNGDI